MSSKFNFPVLDGMQAIKGRADDLRAWQREMPASVADSLRPTIPEYQVTASPVWTCPPGLNGGQWDSPAISPDKPKGRRFGIHVIEVGGETGTIDAALSAVAFLEIIAGDKVRKHYYPSSIGRGEGTRGNRSYTDFCVITNEDAPETFLRFIDYTNGYLPSAQVNNVTLTVTSLWF